jgi:preprotein translocase subunit YajC
MNTNVKNLIIHLVAIIALFSFVYWGIFIKEPSIEELNYYKQQQILYNKQYKQPGDVVETVDGLKGKVVRQCWLGEQVYEVRLSDGTITKVDAKDFIQ